MADMLAFFTCIPHFFRLLWASFVGIFASSWRFDLKSCDIEAGISASSALKDPTFNVDQGLKATTCFLVPPKDGFVEINLQNDPNTLESSSGRPSRRMSAVDPVKSRIVDTTLKQVQDKTINVVKSVVITPGIVTTMPCSAQIEYFNVRIVGHNNAHIKYFQQPIVEHCGNQPEKPNTLIAEPSRCQSESLKAFAEPCSAQIRFTKSRPKHKHRGVQFALPPIEVPYTYLLERRHRKTRAKRNRETLFDLLNQFPDPPLYVPPVPLAPVLTRGQRIEDATEYARPYGIRQSPTSSEKSTSSFGSDNIAFSGSTSDDTAETSAPGTPGTPDTGDFSLLVPDGTRAKGNASIYSSRFLFQVNETIIHPIEVSISHAVIYKDDPLIHTPDGITRRCGGLADSFNKADLEAGDVFEENGSEQSASQFSRADVCGIISSSQSDDSDVAVDSLRAQLEAPSFDSIKRPESLVWFADQSLVKAHLEKPITPLHILKKNKAPVDEKGEVQRESVHWEESLEKVLRAFREAEADDLDFRDLFYRDSSFFSQSSLVNRASSCAIPEQRKDRLRRFDESFESIEKSVEEILAALDLPDPIAVTAEDPASMSLSGEMAIKGLPQDEVKPSDLRVRAPRDDDSEDPYTWIAVTDEDEDKNESEGEDDQWSDMLRLDPYLE